MKNSNKFKGIKKVNRELPIHSIRLCELRNAHGLSQEQVALILGISRQTLSSYETGERNPPIPILRKLARVYHTTISYICGEDSDETFALNKFDEETQNQLRYIIRKSYNK